MSLREPLSPTLARSLCRSILKDHEIRFTGHARQRMAERSMDEADVLNVLRGGNFREPELELGTWRYRVFTPKMWVVIAFRSDTCLVVVTVCREET